jgi:hypothetical protein
MWQASIEPSPKTLDSSARSGESFTAFPRKFELENYDKFEWKKELPATQNRST